MTVEELFIARLLAPSLDQMSFPDTYSAEELENFHNNILERLRNHLRGFPPRDAVEELARVRLYMSICKAYDRVNIYFYPILFIYLFFL